MTRPNALEAKFDSKYDPSDPDGFRTAEAPFGQAAGGKELTVRLLEIPEGQNVCPYHYEYVEEWLLVIAGAVRIRTPNGTESAQAGDLVCFPAGRDGAHQIFNEASAPARVVMFSSAPDLAVAVYPDSDKVGVWTGNKRDEWMFRGAEGHLDYFDGEPQSHADR
jgi:uncharacterized cupin superfamily protein